jgi:hypothetical protein
LQFWCSLAHFILGTDVKAAKRNASQELFLPVFSSLLDAVLFRAQIDTDEHGTDGAPCIPDGLAQFRMNLEELLVDICLLLGAPAYMNKDKYGVRTLIAILCMYPRNGHCLQKVRSPFHGRFQE